MRSTRRPGTASTLGAAIGMLAIAGSTAAAAEPSPSPSATWTWFDGLTPGVCFDLPVDAQGEIDFFVPATVLSCEVVHENEVVARLPIDGGTLPADLDVQAEERCDPEYAAFLGRPIDATILYPFTVWPDQYDWEAGAHDILCVVSGFELIGTAASGDLRAPGEVLAVYWQQEQSADVWLVDAGTGEPIRAVTDDTVTELLSPPAWAPDGQSMAIGIQLSESDVDVIRVGAADGSTTPVITGPGKQDGAAISPDGTTVAYISNDAGGEYDILVRALDAEADAAGTPTTDHPGRDATPRWSPDGERILFRRVTDDLSEIWVMGADGSDPVRLIDNNADSYDPRWSPDGASILYTTDVAGSMDIWIANADGTDARRLTDHPGAEEYPTYSSDGRFIAFQSDRYGVPSVWLMRADGSEASELTGLAPTGYPSFSPVASEPGPSAR